MSFRDVCFCDPPAVIRPPVAPDTATHCPNIFQVLAYDFVVIQLKGVKMKRRELLLTCLLT